MSSRKQQLLCGTGISFMERGRRVGKGKIVARFGLLTAMMFVLSLIDRAIPLSSILGGSIPGVKLGLANTVLLFAIYMINWKGAVLLALVKVLLSGFIFGSLSAIMYSLAGGVLSLAVMLLVKRNAKAGALTVAVLAAASDAVLLYRNPHPAGQMLWCVILIAAAFIFSVGVFIAILKGKIKHVIATSLAGAVAHNVGQTLMASAMLNTPKLLLTYLPVLVGIGAAVGCLTGVVTDRVLRAMKYKGMGLKENQA